MAQSKTCVMADPHIDHISIIDWCKRPFENVRDMNRTIIYNTNAVCGDKDRLIILGDIVWHKDILGYATSLREFLRSLTCKNVILIPGNHDHVMGMRAVGCVGDVYHEINYNGDLWVFSHYAMVTWRNSHRGAYHGYGHSHGELEAALDKMMPSRRSMDFGVDNIAKLTGKYGPMALDEAKARLQERAGWCPWFLDRMEARKQKEQPSTK